MFSLFKQNDTIVDTSPYAGKNSKQSPNHITRAFQRVFSLGNGTKAEFDQKNIAHLGDAMIFLFFSNMESLDNFVASCPDSRPGLSITPSLLKMSSKCLFIVLELVERISAV
jgi:hypothetical protein